MPNFTNIRPQYQPNPEGQTDEAGKAVYAQLMNSIGGALPAVGLGMLKAIGPGAYSGLSDPMMGFNKIERLGNQKGYAEQNYQYNLPVQVQMKGIDPWQDEIKGLNFQHAMARALRNWPGASVVPLQSNLK